MNYNTASLTFEYGSQQQKGFAMSNTTINTFEEIINISKISLEENYDENSEIIFVITVNNNSTETIKNLKITDNLGTYNFSNNNLYNKKLTPINYTGPSFLYISGNFYSKINPVIYSDKLIFNIQNIPAKSNINIIYKSHITEYAPLDLNSKITSITELDSDILTQNINNTKNISCSNNIFTKEHADLSIVKNTSPNIITPGEKITYNFILYNHGNIEAQNVILSDKFVPAPENIKIYINSNQVNKNNFSYINGTLTVPGFNSDLNITVPPAVFSQDSTTGSIITEPGVVYISVTGQI